jgi:hypothetical protein
MHYKRPDAQEEFISINDIDAKLFIYTTDTETRSTADATSYISDKEITIIIDRNSHESLASISDTTLVYFKSSTYVENDKLHMTDHYPGFETLTNIPPTGLFTDSEEDVSIGYIDMLTMSILL